MKRVMISREVLQTILDNPHESIVTGNHAYDESVRKELQDARDAVRRAVELNTPEVLRAYEVPDEVIEALKTYTDDQLAWTLAMRMADAYGDYDHDERFDLFAFLEYDPPHGFRDWERVGLEHELYDAYMDVPVTSSDEVTVSLIEEINAALKHSDAPTAHSSDDIER